MGQRFRDYCNWVGQFSGSYHGRRGAMAASTRQPDPSDMAAVATFGTPPETYRNAEKREYACSRTSDWFQTPIASDSRLDGRSAVAPRTLRSARWDVPRTSQLANIRRPRPTLCVAPRISVQIDKGGIR